MLPAVTPPPPAFDWVELVAKPLLPTAALLGIVPVLCWLFRSTWRELDAEATVWRAKMAAEGRTDFRPIVALTAVAVILTLQNSYGGAAYYHAAVRPLLLTLDTAHPKLIKLLKYDDLFNLGWWAFTRVVGYVLPLALWKVVFPHDSIRDMGFRGRNFFTHAWIYGLFLAIVLVALVWVARQPDFGAYYPFYEQSSRSWFDLLVWEAMYFAQFFALEVFFRGFFVGALRRSFGAGAIFAMALPYCMIHYGKPFLEVNGAIVAGIALGSLSMKTKCIYQGFLVHIAIAASMDWLALWHRHALPTVMWPPP